MQVDDVKRGRSPPKRDRDMKSARGAVVEQGGQLNRGVVVPARVASLNFGTPNHYVILAQAYGQRVLGTQPRIR
ncbi:MAG: hypothetical protein DWQ31_21450 [Planctomycetota bacterium]|nr:MAG: hypothetical protein DWQ31_21450 [Planctomycetota bacterium]REJ93670.1 MAG: hypothetical protein DWQ35_09985 [Planctomycetota bacterium]REK25719.1 MAG: hypothetical protein DWQ42_10725 [Planctomycetota bacterium]REK46535.1 MAG: hypothetical protein DWQ46_06580 [Planctomycetota bacterium]